MHAHIIFIDGYCILCNRFADFVLKNDKQGKFKFATLQGNAFMNLKKNMREPIQDSVILLSINVFYQKSDAVIRILGLLPFPYNLSRICILIPRLLRDYLYDVIAKRRTKLFGRKETCRLPQPHELGKFLD